MAEAFFQHAEHYFRILNAMNQAQQQGQPNGQAQQHPPQANQRRNYQQGDGFQGNEDGQPDPEDADQRPEQRTPGMGEQPEPRGIPIVAAPPES